MEEKEKSNPFKKFGKKKNSVEASLPSLSDSKKTFRLSLMFVVPILGLMLVRAVSSLLPLSDNVSSWVFSFVIQVLFMGVIPFIMYRLMISRNVKDYVADFKIHFRLPAVTFVLAIVIGLVVALLNTGTSVIWAVFLETVGYQYPNGVGTLYKTPEILVMEIITTCMFPAIFEELTDRGLFLAVFEKENDRFKILFVGLCFGILHQNIPQLLPAAIGGVIITYLAVKSGSIIPGMIVHFIINFTVVIGQYAEQTGGWLGGIVGTIEGVIYQNFLVLLIIFAGTIFLTQYLLKQFKTLNIKSRENYDGPSPGGVTIKIPSPTNSPSRELLEIFGPDAISEEEKRVLALELVTALTKAKHKFLQDKAQKGVKAIKRIRAEYIPTYIALIAASIFTILTFIFRYKP